MNPRPAQVHSARPGSAAHRAGVGSGDRLLTINGRRPRDYIEYRYLAAEPRVVLRLHRKDGRARRVVISKTVDEDLGLRFTEDIFDGIRTCRNRCPFCFVSQLPPGLRPALYIRDDDYRLSFLHGNFITLTNLTPADRERIVRFRLSPLYVSVHATDLEVRDRLFGRRASDILAETRGFIAHGIEFHTQIVVLPGVNDGRHLARTVADLASLYPGVRSIGVVPVGLTRHRQRLPALRPVTPRIARQLVCRVETWQRVFRRRFGTRLVFAADELYLRCGWPVPPRAHYEGLWQLGNGIGCARLFLDELDSLRRLRLRERVRVALVTGEMAAEMVKLLAGKLEATGSVSASVCIVRNRLLGRSVTTAGLLAGGDVVHALRSSRALHAVVVPATAVREEEGFVDGMSVEELSRRTGAEVLGAGTPRELVRALGAWEQRRTGR